LYAHTTHCREKETQPDAELDFGIELPKAIESASQKTKKPKKDKGDKPLPIEAGTGRTGEGGGGEGEVLSKAQIKRRRKKALAATMEAGGGLTGVDDDYTMGIPPPVTKAPVVAKETETTTGKGTARGKASVSKDISAATAMGYDGGGKVTKDKRAVTKGKPSVTVDKPTVAMDEPVVTTDKPVVAKDKLVVKDKPAVVQDMPVLAANGPAVTMNEPKDGVMVSVSSSDREGAAVVTRDVVEVPVEAMPLPPRPRDHPGTLVEDASPETIQEIIGKYAQDIPKTGDADEQELSESQMRLLEHIIRNMDIETLKRTMEELDASCSSDDEDAEPEDFEVSMARAMPTLALRQAYILPDPGSPPVPTPAPAPKPIAVQKKVKELTPEAMAERDRMSAAFLNTIMENPVALYMSEEVRLKITAELAEKSYPLVAALLEFANSLAAPLPDEPTEPKRVSVLLDPFKLYTEKQPSNSSLAFVKTKSRVRPPCNPHGVLKTSSIEVTATVQPDKAQQNIQDTLQAGVAKVVSETTTSAKDKNIDLVFQSMEVRRLPPAVQEFVKRRRGEGMDLLPFTKTDMRVMMAAVKKYGVAHDKVRHQDTETLVCFPSEAKLDRCLMDALKRGDVDEDSDLIEVVRGVEEESKRRKAMEAEVRGERERERGRGGERAPPLKHPQSLNSQMPPFPHTVFLSPFK
jgi:hypothetical protein